MFQAIKYNLRRPHSVLLGEDGVIFLDSIVGFYQARTEVCVQDQPLLPHHDNPLVRWREEFTTLDNLCHLATSRLPYRRLASSGFKRLFNRVIGLTVITTFLALPTSKIGCPEFNQHNSALDPVHFAGTGRVKGRQANPANSNSYRGTMLAVLTTWSSAIGCSISDRDYPVSVSANSERTPLLVNTQRPPMSEIRLWIRLMIGFL